MEQELARAGIPGAQAAVRRNGVLLWSVSAGRLGLADRGATEAGLVGIRDRFVVASVTKLVVACVAMFMVERGELELDVPVGRWLPGLPNAGRITARMLLGHRSGLREYFEDDRFARRLRSKPLHPWTRREVLEAVRRLGPEAGPGERYAYKNSNYIALGEVLESCAGESIENLVRERVAGPLGLETLSFSRERPGGGRLASPHVAALGRVFDPLRRTGGEILDDATGEVWTDGGIAASAEDVAILTDALFGGELLRPETVEAMTAPRCQASEAPPSDVPEAHYGLGVSVRSDRGARLLGHNGMYLGWSSVTSFDTRSRATVSVLTNLAGAGVPAERVEKTLRGVLD